MHSSIDKLNFIKKEIDEALSNDYKNKIKPTIIAVCKKFKITDILPLINNGHVHFGENKIQEAVEKWTDVKKDFPNIHLHMIGKLQSNKVKFALKIFDYIHSLDSEKLAKKIADEQTRYDKKPKIFIQVNIGNEDQKSGIKKEELFDFYKFCKNLNLDIIGTMCLPPNNENIESYFSEMNEINQELNFRDLSMGMSGDYLDAVKNNATYVRIGSKIFGNRS